MSGHRHTSFSAPLTRVRLVRRLAIPAVVATAAALLVVSQPASASIVPTVNLATAASYSVIGSTTVTNTGFSILDKGVALSPGTAVDGFPPGIVLPPGTIEVANAVSGQARADLTAAYLDAEGRGVEFTLGADLTSPTPLAPGVYNSTANGPLLLTGEMILDGQDNPNAVFIFKTGSTLTAMSDSVVTLINGASECNIFWQVGSSATIGTNSEFVGNIMALTSVTVETDATIQGRAMARNGAVTLDDNTFTSTLCAFGPAPPATTTTTTTPEGGVTTIPGPATTASPGATVAPTVPGFGDTDITLPRTGGRDVTSTSMIGGFVLVLGAAAIGLARRRRPAV
jgi:LPXTG-motif cell wall-anchored protein